MRLTSRKALDKKQKSVAPPRLGTVSAAPEPIALTATARLYWRARTNWLVHDEAAASLISYFCASLAKAEASVTKDDHAAALHQAKSWVRKQDTWQSPYYWGTFVLVGPN